MKRRDDLEVAAWLGYADEDEAIARILFDQDATLYRAIGFHCQQACEKRLKALIVADGEEPPYTHRPEALLGLVAGFLPSATSCNEAVVRLSPFAVQMRYPGFEQPVADPAGVSQQALSAMDVLSLAVLSAFER